jgi:GH15 family glucan-1,4-alpha-glucosidase
MLGRYKEAKQVFERLLCLCNDLGLISEEYDPQKQRLVGNFPQAFTHVGLINTALNLRRQGDHPAEHRSA